MTFLAPVSTLAASIYSPSHAEVSEEFDVTEVVAILPLALCNLGLAFGPLVGAPLSETCGRKEVFLSTTPIFAAFTLGAGLSKKCGFLECLQVFRRCLRFSSDQQCIRNNHRLYCRVVSGSLTCILLLDTFLWSRFWMSIIRVLEEPH